MKKMMFAALSLVTMFAIAGGNGTPPAAASPTTSVAPGCTVTCDGTPVPGLTIRQCTEFCRGTCDILC